MLHGHKESAGKCGRKRPHCRNRQETLRPQSLSTVIQGALENTLNDLDHGGYVPWEFQYIDVQDSQDPVNPRKVVRILARGKWVTE